MDTEGRDLTIPEKLGAAVATTGADLPYAEPTAASLRPVAVPGLGTCATDAGRRFMYDEKILARCTARQVWTFHAHETAHHLLGHFERRDSRPWKRWNKATDQEVYQVLEPLRPAYPFRVISPESLGVPRGLSAEAVDAILAQREQEQQDAQQPPQPPPPDSAQDSNQEEEPDQQPQDSGQDSDPNDDDASGEADDDQEEQDGDGDGTASNDDEDDDEDDQDGRGSPQDGPQDDDDDEEGEGTGGGAGDDQDEEQDDDGPGGDGTSDDEDDPVDPEDPETWKTGEDAPDPEELARRLGDDAPPPYSPEEAAVDQYTTAEKVGAYAATYGTTSVAGAVREWAAAVLRPRSNPWQRILKSRIARAAAQMQGFDDFDKRIARVYFQRSAATGRRDLPVVRSTKAHKPRPFIVADVSGSMQAGNRMEEVRDEVAQIVKAAAGGPAEMIAVDTAVVGRGKVRSTSDAERIMRSGGGTDMAYGIREAARLGADLIVVLTDGETGWPSKEEMRRMRARVIVALTSDGTEPPAHIGNVVRMGAPAA